MLLRSSTLRAGRNHLRRPHPAAAHPVDGDELTRLMVQYGVGVRTDRTSELRKLDLDYFEEDVGVE